MPAMVDIGVRVSGAEAAKAQLASIGRQAADTAKVADTAGTSQAGGLSMRREFMAGQQLQRSITGLLGVNNIVTQVGDGFERLNYMAEASGVSMGKMLRTIAPGALAAAGLAVAFSVVKGRLDEIADAGKRAFSDQGISRGYLDSLMAGLGLIEAINSGLEQTADRTARIGRGFDRFKIETSRRVEDSKAGDVTPFDREATVARRKREDLERERSQIISDNEQFARKLEEQRKAVGAATTSSALSLVYTEATGKEASYRDTIFNQSKLKEEAEAAIAEKISQLQKNIAAQDAAARVKIEQAADEEILANRRAKMFNAAREFWSRLTTGDARLPSADVYGSREAIANRQQIEQRDVQQEIARQQLQQLETIAQKLSSGQVVGVFSMEGLN